MVKLLNLKIEGRYRESIAVSTQIDKISNDINRWVDISSCEQIEFDERLKPRSGMKKKEIEFYDDEIDLFEYVSLLWRRKWLIIFITFICCSVAIFYAFYVAEEIFGSKNYTDAT